MTNPSAPLPVATAAGSYVDWPAILAGAVLAAAISVVLMTFGSAVGLSVVSAEPGEGVSLAWLSIASGIWFVWVAISSFAAGGYLAGRLRRPFEGASVDEVETRDGAHGVLVWATGALVGVLLAAAGASGLAGAAGGAAGTVAETAATAVSGDIDRLGSRLLRSTEAGSAAGAADARQEVAGVLTRSLASGEVVAEDRAYLAELIAARTGQTLDEARAAVEATIAEAEQLYAAAIDTAERARTATAIAAFVVAATLMASATAAYFAAVLGGDHRDRQHPFRDFGR